MTTWKSQVNLWREAAKKVLILAARQLRYYPPPPLPSLVALFISGIYFFELQKS